MTTIRVRFDDNHLDTFQNQLKALGERKARQGLARAANHTARKIKTRVSREIAKQSSIPVSIVKKAVRLQLASHKGTGPIEARVYAAGKPLSLKLFKPKQFAKGTRAKVWGRFEMYESAFIYGGNWKTKKEAFGGHVMSREGKSKFPVRREAGPSIPAELIRANSVAAFHEMVARDLPERARHELQRLLTGGAS